MIIIIEILFDNFTIMTAHSSFGIFSTFLFFLILEKREYFVSNSRNLSVICS